VVPKLCCISFVDVPCTYCIGGKEVAMNFQTHHWCDFELIGIGKYSSAKLVVFAERRLMRSPPFVPTPQFCWATWRHTWGRPRAKE